MSTLTVKAIEAPVGFDLQMPANAMIDGQALTAYRSEWPSRKNIIINGGFDVWQRGTTITSNASANMFYADRWKHEGYTFNGSVTQQTFTNGQTDVPDNPTYFARLIITTNSSGYQAFVQRIENNPVNRFSGKTITVSFWIKSASGTLADGTVKAYGRGGVVGDGTDNIGAITTSWQKIEYTGTLGILTGTYFTVGLKIDQGTLLTSGVDIANFQVEVGDTATPFEYRSYGEELALCQRYAWVISNANGKFIGTGHCRSTTVAEISISPKVSFRTTPTLVVSDATKLNVRHQATNSASSAVTIAGSNEDIITLQITTGAVLTAGEGCSAWVNGGTVTIEYNAEL